MPLFTRDHHLYQLLLGHLERGDRHVELHPLLGICQGRLVTRAGRTHRTEGDPEPGFVETRQRAAHRRHVWE